MYFYLCSVNYLILRGLNIVLFREYSVNILILWDIPMTIELINILSTHQTDFFSHFFFQNLIDLKLTVWKKNNERSVFFLIRQKCSLFSYAAYGWVNLRIFNQSVKNSLHNFWSFYQIREKTALSFVDFIKVYFFICNDLQCVEYAL